MNLKLCWQWRFFPWQHPEESTTNLLDWYYCVLFQDCENMLFIACSTLFSWFGKWDLLCECTSVEFDRVVPHWWIMPMVMSIGKLLPISCLDLHKIMVRLFSPCNTVVVSICYGLICSLVAVHNCGTCLLTF